MHEFEHEERVAVASKDLLTPALAHGCPIDIARLYLDTPRFGSMLLAGGPMVSE